MRTLPAGLQAHLDEGATTLCHCLRLETHDGEVLGFTDHDRDLSFDGVTFEAQPGFSPSAIEAGTGLAPANLEIAGALSSDRLTEARLRAGAYDHAAIDLYLVNWKMPDQRLLLRSGHLGEMSHGEAGFNAEIRGLVQLLDQPKGRVFQYGCDAVLGDGRCRVDLGAPAFRGEAVVTASEDGRRLIADGLGGFAAGWFAGGVLSWNSGANQGREADVKHHRLNGGLAVLELWQAMTDEVVAGDAFSITAGCDKQFATCKARFSNGVNFRGFPHMPGNDFVASYPNRDDPRNDGGSRL